MTLTELVTQISADILRDPSNRVWSLLNLRRQINLAYQTLQSDLIGFIATSEKSANISLIPWTAEYSLPSDYLSTESVRIINWLNYSYELDLISKSDTSGQSWWSNAYYIYGGLIGFYPIAIKSETAQMLYNAKLPDLSDSQDTATPVEANEAIKYLTAAICFKQVAKFDNAQMYEQEYFKQINRIKVLLFGDANFDYMPSRSR